VRHDPHLDLGVVRRQERLEPGPDDERTSDLATRLGPDGDVLQVGVGRRQPAGRCDGLLERRVDARVVGHGAQQALDRLPQPDGVPVREEVRQERVLGALVQVSQRRGVGRVAGIDLLRLRHAELVEEHLLQLLRGAEVHVPADDVVGLERGRLHLRVERRLELGEVVGVRGDPALLHAREHVLEW